MKKQFLAVLVSATLIGVAGPAGAEPIVDTGHVVIDSGGDVGWQFTAHQSFAAEFTTTKQYSVRSLEGFLAVLTGGALRLSLYTDGGDIPGERLFTTVLNLEETAARWLGATNLSWSISPSTYWVAFEGTAEAGTFDPFLGSFFFGQNPLLHEALKGNADCCPIEWNGNADFLDLSVRIFGDPTSAPIPEPSTILLLSAAGIAAVCRRRILRRGSLNRAGRDLS